MYTYSRHPSWKMKTTNFTRKSYDLEVKTKICRVNVLSKVYSYTVKIQIENET